MNETNNRGSALATASLISALIALLGPSLLGPIFMTAMLQTHSTLPDYVLMMLLVLQPVGGALAAVCGHIARRRLDINRSPQKSAVALAGLIIGYAVIIQCLSGQIIGRLGSLLSRGM